MGALISVIVTTYRREEALAAVLRSLAAQTDSDFEVVVADDGSGPATATLIEAQRAQFSNGLTHVWHADLGFRAAEIRNRAILASRGEYCIFIDGDCLVRPDFVTVHRFLAEPGWFVTGNRVLLSPGLTERVLSQRLQPEQWSARTWLVERWRGEVNRLSALWYIPLGPLRRLRQTAWQDARSCNFGVWRADLLRIDGFDGNYVGWGREDSDLFVRLLNSGLSRKDGIFATGVLHLWHPAADRRGAVENDEKLSRSILSGNIRAQHGLSTIKVPKITTATRNHR